MDDNVGIPEDLRCKRSDGKQWRCSALSMPDKTVCEKHYIQAKKRAANSAMRANLKKAKRKSVDHRNINYFDDRNDEMEMSGSPLNNTGGGGEYSSPTPTKKHKGKARKGQGLYSSDMMMGKGGSSARLRPREEQFEEDQVMPVFSTPPRGKTVKNIGGSSTREYFGRSTDSSGEAEGLTCHQCRRNDRVKVLWCMNCDKRGYCDICAAKWYANISMDDIRRGCPSCRGICSCTVCRRGDTLIKARIREVSSIKRLQCLHSLLSFVLPVLKDIHSEQCSELDVESRINGIKSDIPRAKINPDEQMCCDICSIPIVDYHRHCANCLTDLCLHCVQDLRQSGAKEVRRECQPAVNLESSARQDVEYLAHSTDRCTLDLSHLFPRWKVNRDGSIPCRDNRCRSFLVLRRIFKINWVTKLVKNAEEMVGGCRVSDLGSSERCISCSGSELAQSSGFSESELYKCSHREDSGDNFLYSPASQDINHKTISHFRNHWIKGEPVIVRQVIDFSLASSWDPMSIWRGIQDMTNERIKEDNVIVKAIDCLTHSEVDIELEDFMRGYSEGRTREDNTPEILKLKEWPHPNAFEDFLLCQRPELLTKLPLLEYIHSRWGLLNLAAKLPHDTLQNDAGARLCIAYGTHEELGRGDSVMNLKINMGDTVYLLMHITEMKFRNHEYENNKSRKFLEESAVNNKPGDAHIFDFDGDGTDRMDSPDSLPNEHNEQSECFSTMTRKEDDVIDDRRSTKSGDDTCVQETNVEAPQKDNAGVIWDVFRRKDIPSLNEYLRVHAEELQGFDSASPSNKVENLVYDQTYFLNSKHKRKLKQELGIEPWTFKQHLGEAVFIPAGCAFQMRNLKSAVQLALDFLSPESLAESIHLAQEIRCLPNDHVAKLQMLEVAKMPLYAASWAIREIQKITLDPKVGSELGFEDRNLTAKVSDNLQRMIKRNRIVCA